MRKYILLRDHNGRNGKDFNQQSFSVAPDLIDISVLLTSIIKGGAGSASHTRRRMKSQRRYGSFCVLSVGGLFSSHQRNVILTE